MQFIKGEITSFKSFYRGVGV